MQYSTYNGLEKIGSSEVVQHILKKIDVRYSKFSHHDEMMKHQPDQMNRVISDNTSTFKHQGSEWRSTFN